MRALLCVTLALALGGCGGGGNNGGGSGGGGGSSCSVSVSGAPTSGTYITCLVGMADANGYATLQGQGIAGCDSCSFTASVLTTGQATCAYGPGDHGGLSVTDKWPNAPLGDAETFYPPGSPPVQAPPPTTPCTIITNSYTPQQATPLGTGHWSGTIDGTVYTIDGNGNPIDTTMVHISGSF